MTIATTMTMKMMIYEYNYYLLKVPNDGGHISLSFNARETGSEQHERNYHSTSVVVVEGSYSIISGNKYIHLPIDRDKKINYTPLLYVLLLNAIIASCPL